MTDSTLRERDAGRTAGPVGPTRTGSGEGTAWSTPSVEVISLSCEISAYAPDDDGWPRF